MGMETVPVEVLVATAGTMVAWVALEAGAGRVMEISLLATMAAAAERVEMASMAAAPAAVPQLSAL